MDQTIWIVIGAVSLVALVFIFFILKWILSLRRVVPTSEVHVVSQGKNLHQYGGEKGEGNSYYRWPEWFPLLGTSVTVLDLTNMEFIVDNEKLPFSVDLYVNLRICDYLVAAKRAANKQDLHDQLKGVVKGVARRILAQDALETIMMNRGKYGNEFTKEISEDISAWGVEPVKLIEFTDIKDARGESVIANIMNKRKSWIEKDSRITVAKNQQEAREAEIAAQQEIDLKQKTADEVVGLRAAEVDKKVGIAKQQSDQAVKEEEKVTMEKNMQVRQVETVRSAEIARDAKIVEAEADRSKTEIDAEASKRKAELDAEATLVRATKNAEGIKAEGDAKAEAEKQMQLASVMAQTTLAKEIGENDGYQKYLIEIRKVEATEKVGLAQAENMSGANIKVIANAGDVASGVSSALDVLTPKGGASLAGAIEALATTDAGKALLTKLGLKIEK